MADKKSAPSSSDGRGGDIHSSASSLSRIKAIKKNTLSYQDNGPRSNKNHSRNLNDASEEATKNHSHVSNTIRENQSSMDGVLEETPFPEGGADGKSSEQPIQRAGQGSVFASLKEKGGASTLRKPSSGVARSSGASKYDLPTPFSDENRGRSNSPQGPDDEVLSIIEKARKRFISKNSSLLPRDGGHGATEGTLRSYANRGRLLLNRFKRESGIPTDMDDFEPCDFSTWLLSLRQEIKPATWRLYKQGGLYVIEGLPHPDVDEAIRMLNNDQSIDKRMDPWDVYEEDKKKQKRTSALKEKRFPKEDFDRVIAYIDHVSRAKRAPELKDWLIAAVNTGLRPIEWRATAIEETGVGDNKKLWLHIMNAKATNGRGNGLARTIEITNYTPDVLRAIKRMSERGLSWFEQGSFDEIKGHISQLLYHMCKTIFPSKKSHYSLYSCRHQFIANMKSVYPLEEVSALVGHGTDVTTAERYGLRRNAWSPDAISQKPAPLPGEVATVKQQMRFVEERRRIRQAIGLPPKGVM